MPHATSLRPGQIRHLLRVTVATSRRPERDTLVLLLGLTAGMRVTEIAGILGGSSHSGRRTKASRLIQQATDVETVQLLPGHAELDHVRPYLQVSQKKLEEMFRTVL